MARISRKQKQFSNKGVEFSIDIDPVMEAIAMGYVLSDNKKNAKYLDTVVDIAFERADETLQLETDAYAASTGNFSHMYEWGTLGINRGRTNVRQAPSAPNAKLWHTFTFGQGLNRLVSFVYKPSFANVPKPTVAETGMAQDVIASLRTHVFTWKAKVIDEAQDVTISTKSAKFLLIPAYRQNRPYMRPHDIKRGYALMEKPMRARPGGAEESFAAWWAAFWLNRGTEIVEASVQTQMLSDVEPELRKSRPANKPVPVGTFSVGKKLAVKEKEVQKRLEAKARLRAMKEGVDDE